MSRFERRFKQAVQRAINRDDDGYTEVKYSDTFIFHIGGHPDGDDGFEIDIIVPHRASSNYKDIDGRNVKFGQIDDDSERVYEKARSLVDEVTNKEQNTWDPYLLEVVDDGTWKEPASWFASQKLEPAQTN